MKKMIISPAQLKAINEAAALTYARSSSPADVTAAVNGMIGKTNSNEVQVKIPGNTGPAQATTLPDLQKGNETTSPETSMMNVTVDPTKTGLTETKYTKRQVELGRMLEMRKNGKVFSKKQLNEMFMEGEYDDGFADKLRNSNAFDVMLMFGQMFPEENQKMLDIFSNGGNPTDFIVSVVNNSGPEMKKEFCRRAHIK